MPRIRKPKVELSSITLQKLHRENFELLPVPIRASYYNNRYGIALGFIVARYSSKKYVAFQRDDKYSGYFCDGCWYMEEKYLCHV